MNTSNLFLTMLAIVLFSFGSNAQQWTGTSSTSSEIYRTGRVGLGIVNPPNDTQLYVKTSLKAGIVSNVHHTVDYKFGIISGVNRANTKAFSVLLKVGTAYNDTFVVFGNGNVIATEVKVKTPIFPDYVFESDYNLLPLSDLECFIKTNKRLPNIPSAKEITENGLELGNMQVKQMEKIEELYLYIINLEKRIQTLEKQKITCCSQATNKWNWSLYGVVNWR